MKAQTWRWQYPLSRRKILKKSMGPAFKMTLIALVVSVPYFFLVDKFFNEDASTDRAIATLTWFGIVLIAIAWAPFVQYLYYRTYFYDADDQNVVIRKGIITQQEITLPFSKITDVYVDQDGLDVCLGLWDVHISTPTVSSGQIAHIDGVSRASSVALRETILERINLADKPEKTERSEIPESI